MAAKAATSTFQPDLVGRATVDAFKKLNPAALMRNPVIFVTEIVAVVVTILFLRDVVAGNPLLFTGQIMAWLWFTVLFANFAEAIAEGRGRAQAASLRQARTDTVAKRLADRADRSSVRPISALDLKIGDHVLVETGDIVPGDGEIVDGLEGAHADPGGITTSPRRHRCRRERYPVRLPPLRRSRRCGLR